MQKVIKNAAEMNYSIKVVQYQRYSKISFVVQSKEADYTADIATIFPCTFKTAAKQTCSHLVRLLISVFKIEKTNSVLAQIEISRESFSEFNDSLPDHLLQAVTQCTSKRRFPQKLKEHSKFNSEQIWYISFKKNGVASFCFGYMMLKQMKIGDLHLYVQGLLYLEKDGRVVETKLRFCLKRECVTNIKSSFNNITALDLNTVIKKDPLLAKLCKEQIANIELEGFKIQVIQRQFII